MSIYGFLIGLAFVVGAQYFSYKNKTIPKNKENIFIFLLFVTSLIGARTYSVIGDWSYYSQDPIQILNTRGGGMGIYGGLIFGLVFIFLFAQKNRIDFLSITNTIAPIIPLAQSIGRWGNFFNKEVFGIPTYSSYGQYIPPTFRPNQFQSYSYFHPVWLYESILNLLFFIVLIKAKRNQTAYYLVGYGIIRFALEFLRWDTFMINQIKIAQILSILLIIIGITLTKIKNV